MSLILLILFQNINMALPTKQNQTTPKPSAVPAGISKAVAGSTSWTDKAASAAKAAPAVWVKPTPVKSFTPVQKPKSFTPTNLRKNSFKTT